MTSRLTAYLSGKRVGWFSDSGNSVEFVFDDEWRNQAKRSELSLSMLKSARVHKGAAPTNWLWGLLPDNDRVLERWGQRFGVSPRNPMAILAHVGMDAAGAIQITEQDEPILTGPSGFERMTDAEIGAHIAELREDPTAWLVTREHNGYFSLAGAQAKFALAKTREGWAVPTGRAASTHIFKPGIAGMNSSDLGEHLAMDTASRLGLGIADSRIMHFDGESAIVVKRYDRLATPQGEILRLHQEDLTQAAAVHPAIKYQNEGGPGIVQAAGLLRTAARTPNQGDAMVQKFFEANLYNFVIAGTDAHAKNYSVLLGAAGVSLAPFYDIQSILGHARVHEREIRLAMSITGHYLAWEVRAREVFLAAEEVGLDGNWAVEQVRDLARDVPQALSDAVAASGVQSDFTTQLLDRIAEHAGKIERRFSKGIGDRPVTKAKRSTQPRRPAGTPGAGKFAPKPNR